MRWPEDYNIIVKHKVYNEVAQFYYHLSKKYINTYDYKEIDKLIKKHIQSISEINHTKMISGPILEKWEGLGRVVIGKWNFAVKIEGNNVNIVDACHELNMTNNPEIQEQEEIPYHNSRINKVTFPPHIPGKPYLIRAIIDGESAGLKTVTKQEYERAIIDKDYAIQLAEKYYHKELQDNRFNIDRFLNKTRNR